MKRHILVLLAFFAVSTVFAQTSINFESGNWESILKKAKAEDKIVFVDAYTTWCGPCKMMSKNVFTDPSVAAFYNKNFINVKLDMEKGEGVLFGKAYDIRFYPTYVFVDGDGELAHKGLGYMKPDLFIDFGKSATDEANRLGTLIAKYKNGERRPEFLKQYSEALASAYDDQTDEIAHQYLSTQTNWNTEKNAPYLVDMFKEDPKTKLCNYVIENRKELMPFVDAKQLDEKIKIAVMRQVHNKNMNYDEQAAYFNEVFDDRGKEYFTEYNMKKYSRATDEEMLNKFFETATDYFTNYQSTDWQILNRIAWSFYEKTDDVNHLRNAAAWAKTSVDLDNNFMNNDTLASLYYELGDKKRALEAANTAIELAKEANQDYSETSELLNKIEAL